MNPKESKIYDPILAILKIIAFPTYYFYYFTKLKASKENKGIITDNTKVFYMGTIILLLGLVEIISNKSYRNSYYIMFISALSCFLSIYFFMKLRAMEFSNGRKINIKISIILFSILIEIIAIYYNTVLLDNPATFYFVLALIYIYGVSRIGHLFFVFVTDAIKVINGNKEINCKDIEDDKSKDMVDPKCVKPDSNAINKAARRVSLILKSYINLFLDYALLFYILNNFFGYSGIFSENNTWIGKVLLNNYFDAPFNNIFEAIYFSVISITTVGYGDISPKHTISRIYVVLEILSGMFLLAMNLVIYIGERDQNINLENVSRQNVQS